MIKQILLFIGGVILGFTLFFVFSLVTPSSIQNTKLNDSSDCGVVTPFKYCGSNNYLCTVNCNICGCDKPNCTFVSSCVP